MAAPYKHAECFRRVYLSKASTVEEDRSKSSDDETRFSRETDIDDIGGVVEGEARNAKKPNVAIAVSLVNARKQKESSGRDINYEERL